jgi:thymidylate synthase
MMRLFQNINEAAREIRRDLTKAPEMQSTRVQQFEKDLVANEWLNYAYTIEAEGVPADFDQVAIGLAEVLPYYLDEGNRLDIKRWLEVQLMERAYASQAATMEPEGGDSLHPVLQSCTEGNAFSYTYRERMVGMLPTIARTLVLATDTRRAYWPIFTQQDSHRAMSYTRIPCTLGYYFVVREVPGLGPRLHLTYIQRSVDFEIFWLTDVFLAVAIQRELAQYVGIELGQFSHIILSFHRFQREGEEIY